MMRMDEISSAEFRKRYAKLEAATRVTVNGHVIGVWTPSRPFTEGTIAIGQPGDRDYWPPRPFTPVPKPAPKRRK